MPRDRRLLGRSAHAAAGARSPAPLLVAALAVTGTIARRQRGHVRRLPRQRDLLLHDLRRALARRPGDPAPPRARARADRRARRGGARRRGRGAGADRARAARRRRARDQRDRAAGARRAARRRAASATRRSTAIESTGATALAEMRRLLAHAARRRRGRSRSRRSRRSRTSSSSSPRCATPGCPSSCASRASARELPPGVDVSAYRIVQEALTNALKHAGPARARVSVRYGADALELEIADTGAGRRERRRRRHGLVGMRERVAVFGGELESRPARRAAASRSARGCRCDPRPPRRRPAARPLRASG